MADHTLVFIVLGLTLAAFVWGRFRYDLVALSALLACVILGLVPGEEAFYGFGHPAVITVAAVLVLSRGFERSGVVDVIAEQVLKVGDRLFLQLVALTATVVVLSGFMNNVGALALLLPVAMRLAREHNISPSLLLMPLAFGSLLGGLMTLIGTPPNIIIASYRGSVTGETFGMFSFFPVGASVALAGLVFIVLLGWRLVPQRAGNASTEGMFDISYYLVEVRVDEEAKALGWTLRELQRELEETLPVLAVLRGKQRYAGHAFLGALKEGDILLVEAGPEEMKLLEDKAGLRVGIDPQEETLEQERAEAEESGQLQRDGSLPDAENGKGENKDKKEKKRGTSNGFDTEGLELVEAVVRNDSVMVNRTVTQLRLHNQYGMHLVAVARDGSRLRQRLRDIRFRPGDVLLLQGGESNLSESLTTLGCLPLAKRNFTLGQPRMLLVSIGIFALAIAAMLLDILPNAIALALAALVTLLVGVLPLRDGYQAIDGPVIILLGAMIPVGSALETSGGAALIANSLLELGGTWPTVSILILLFVTTMMLSDIINNAAAAVLMAPIAVSLANGFGASIDPFLMVVAVSASCAFLTPIGHQSNTLVMGPGGYRFGDYWRMGLPLELVVMAVAIPMILLVWPL
ncbi:SLC13 family permease [Halomonas daqingensis]|uniref:SLC13 family permease n=1 Tax=Billgrantia desiderata TaxID=52021 RepID=A0ABS9B3L1_9GAMM|nr:SLC13 family permease [Halomonas desiderata]MCE8041923.1 SLC13 family permease [Halomonas desiderata]MCE8046498.1 SLC13 family permease [Halomonas desiderata]